jgi:hypothetical protein
MIGVMEKVNVLKNRSKSIHSLIDARAGYALRGGNKRNESYA